MPYFKLHFYKTDQYIYNYPYTVGYLLSQFLLGEFRRAGDKFIGAYKAFLRECGVMSVEDLLQKHFGKDTRERWSFGSSASIMRSFMQMSLSGLKSRWSLIRRKIWAGKFEPKFDLFSAKFKSKNVELFALAA